MGVFFLRASILDLYMHLFQTRPFRITCYIMHGLNTGYTAATVLGAFLICQPLSALWNPRTGSCGSQKSLGLFIGIFNLLLDVCVVILPMPVLWRLQMSMAKKVALTGIFGMGVVYVNPPLRQQNITTRSLPPPEPTPHFLPAPALIPHNTSSICIITLVRIWVTSLIYGRNSPQIYATLVLLTCLEALLGVINTCLPIMRPVFIELGKARIWSYFPSASIIIGGAASKRSFFSRRSGNRSSNREGKNGSGGYAAGPRGKGGEGNPSWPTPQPRDPAHRFVDPKAVRMTILSHPSQQSISTSEGAPPPPPKSLDRQPDNLWWEDKKAADGIVVQRDWDVERAGSAETDQRPLNW
ncbi:MAG: hypothetical protein Q9163_003942 [Psora crenata]